MGHTKAAVVNGPKRHRKLCLKGQRHIWVMGAALVANDGGDLVSGGRARTHLNGTCRRCHKTQAFHPMGQHQRFVGQHVLLPGLAA